LLAARVARSGTADDDGRLMPRPRTSANPRISPRIRAMRSSAILASLRGSEAMFHQAREHSRAREISRDVELLLDRRVSDATLDRMAIRAAEIAPQAAAAFVAFSEGLIQL
jgi:hypothetical protein